ncbi:methylglyoxal synthase [Panacibacter ginsenosidivorans]|uniref:Methylglyoxal synthase n=1 Tax=Panacibacter ginsenosidivorans TaxID=1813871 RepID=A0A5B8V7X7_9BACT|nr:methylglyoxal synthase [Panacibacter ginsenosidivorans]QEC67275.1 methylglyoxal synthase [Panacibacter ginsenosidivorans]
MEKGNMTTVKRIAITAQEHKKTELIEWSYFKREALAKHQLIATGTTADIIEGTVDVPVQKILSGAVGGYTQLATMIEEGKIDALIFFSDAMKDSFNNSDIRKLLELAISHNIIVCCNRTTADYVMDSILMNESYTPEGPAYIPASKKGALTAVAEDEIKLAV